MSIKITPTERALEIAIEALRGMCEDFFDMHGAMRDKYSGKPLSHIARDAIKEIEALLPEEKETWTRLQTHKDKTE